MNRYPNIIEKIFLSGIFGKVSVLKKCRVFNLDATVKFFRQAGIFYGDSSIHEFDDNESSGNDDNGITLVAVMTMRTTAETMTTQCTLLFFVFITK